YNQWNPFTDNHNNPIIIGRDRDKYLGVRAVIGGSNNHLLFITYYFNNISVFGLNTFRFIKHDTLPTKIGIIFHCFVSNSENVQEQEMMKTNKQNDKMLLFCKSIGLSIKYNEENNIFQFHQLSVSDNVALLHKFAYVCINDAIFFTSKSVRKYSIRENKWITFQNNLPIQLCHCVAVLNEEDNDIHIIGGRDDEKSIVSTHMKTKVRVWNPSHLVMIYLFIALIKHK
ncbi:hypothetical protein RFI_25150, partial [Reticulomyxa filosa]